MRAAKRRIPPAKLVTEAGFLECDHAARHRRHHRGLGVGATRPRVFGGGSSVAERGNNGLAIHTLTPGLTDALSRQSRGFARLIPWIRDCKIAETSGPRLEPLAVLLVDRCGMFSTVPHGGSGSSQRVVVSNQKEFSQDSGPRAHPRGCGYETMPRLTKGRNFKCKADCPSQLPGDLAHQAASGMNTMRVLWPSSEAEMRNTIQVPTAPGRISLYGLDRELGGDAPRASSLKRGERERRIG